MAGKEGWQFIGLSWNTLSNYTEISLLIYDHDEWFLIGKNKMPSQQVPFINFTLMLFD